MVYYNEETIDEILKVQRKADHASEQEAHAEIFRGETIRRVRPYMSEPRWSNFYWDLDVRQDYLISDRGVVWDTERDRQVSASPNQYGDIRVNLGANNDKGYKTVSVRHSVAMAFVTAPSSYYSVALAKDNDPTNNCADNIVWRPAGFARAYKEQFREFKDWYMFGPVTEESELQHEFSTGLSAAVHHGVMVSSVYDSCELDGQTCLYLDIGFRWS